jgi:hypothetical protein
MSNFDQRDRGTRLDNRFPPRERTPLDCPSHGPHTRTAPTKWAGYRNLSRRPHAPNAGRGRVQISIRRAFMVGGPELTSSEVYDWTQPRPRGREHYWNTKRILCEIADRIGRAPTIGRPWIWRLKPVAE